MIKSETRSIKKPLAKSVDELPQTMACIQYAKTPKNIAHSPYFINGNTNQSVLDFVLCFAYRVFFFCSHPPWVHPRPHYPSNVDCIAKWFGFGQRWQMVPVGLLGFGGYRIGFFCKSFARYTNPVWTYRRLFDWVCRVQRAGGGLDSAQGVGIHDQH